MVREFLTLCGVTGEVEAKGNVGIAAQTPMPISVRQWYKGLAMHASMITWRRDELSHELCAELASDYADTMIAEDKKHENAPGKAEK